MIVPRTVTTVQQDASPGRRSKLSDFRDERFYVLLGSPGAGKTTAFEAEARHVDDSRYLTARQVVRSHTRPRSEWREKTLFIDGLDEVRAGKHDVRKPLDCILDCLDQLDSPRARLSCRSAAWLTTSDIKAIRSVPGYERLEVLQLDPLTERDVREILDHRLGKAAYGFFEAAHSRRLHGLLDNPLSLKMLVKAMGKGDEWPESRVETFKLACRALANEVNDEHRTAVRYGRPLGILDAASRTAALYLLAGKDGIAWDRSDVDDPDSVLLINKTSDCDRRSTRLAWESGLFVPQRSMPGLPHGLLALDDEDELSVPQPPPGAHLPVHEHVAEYLAARHLKKAVAGTAVLARVLSLLTAGGGVPSPLRGVAAWLAALCPDARRLLIDLDPVGVVAYGDIGVFDEDERAHVLDRLSAHAGPSADPWNLPYTALGGLVTPRTMNDLRSYMNGNSRSETVQQAVAILLRGVAAAPLRCGDQVSGKELLATARDSTWSLPVRHSALAAAIELPDNPDDVTMRMQLLKDINAGKVDDPVGDLRAYLFRDLYPSRLPPKEAWDYLPIPVNPIIGAQLSQSSPRHCGQLLDSLHARVTQPDYKWDISLEYLAWELLERAIEADGESVRVEKLYNWIELAAFNWGAGMWSHRPPDNEIHARFGGTDPVHTVQQWLANHPAVQKELLVTFLHRHAHEQEIDLASQAMEFWQTVFGGGQPDDFHEWCFQQALAMSAEFENPARWLVECAVEPRRRSMSADEWLPTALRRVDDDPVLVDQLRALAEHDRERRRREMQYRTRRPKRKATLASQVLEHRDALLKGAGPEGLLVELGRTYFGYHHVTKAAADLFEGLLVDFGRTDFGDFGEDPVDGAGRLRAKLASNDDATDVALNALARVPTGEAGPDIPEIMKLDGERRCVGALPFLAGLDIMARRGADVPGILGEGLERAVWCYLATPLNDPEVPGWFADLLESHAEMVATVFVKLHRNRIRSKQDDSALLPLDERYRHVARLALPDLLKAFPAKGYGTQLLLLRQVLVAAILHVPEEVASRVRKRMAVRKMNGAQRITWLGAGVAVAPSEFVPAAVAFVEEGRPARGKHLVDVLHAVRKAYKDRPLFDAATEPAAVALLVSTLGRRHRPFWSGVEGGIGGYAVLDNASTLVEHMILGCLADNPARDASLELDRLSKDSGLKEWHNTLREGLERQLELRYSTEHNIPTVKEVEDVLRDGPPASAADLTALVVDRLERLAREIRDSSTDDWQQYWNEDKGRKNERRPPWPKDENLCRNALLSALRQRLPSGVDAHQEASYAEEARADIRVCFGSHAIPIEIKKSSHRELWSAMRKQLMAKYARDPESAGHGVYVVLWFGSGGPEPAKTPPTGPRPKSPDELARRLKEYLSEAERLRIKIVVVDVSRPATVVAGGGRSARRR